MEPEAKPTILEMDDKGNRTSASISAEAHVSIAISLKRIADALTYQPVGSNNLFDYIREMASKNG